MKKTILFSPLIFLLIVTPVLAAKQQTSRPQTEDSVVQSGNQVDDDTQSTSSAKDKNSRSQNAYQHMSRVAQSVEKLLETRIEGGIGTHFEGLGQA